MWQHIMANVRTPTTRQYNMLLVEHGSLWVERQVVQDSPNKLVDVFYDRYNGKSLSWMGLTRERWCCTRGFVSRLDMNTCQMSIKTDILL